MMLLYAGPTGKWKPKPLDSDEQLAPKSVSSGKMEHDLIEYFKHESYPNLKHQLLGGEGASSGCPHFTYAASAL